MNLNDPQFKEFYKQRGLQGKRVSRSEAQALWAEYSGNQEAATKQATSLLDSVQERPAMTPNVASLSQDTFAPADIGITRTTKKDPILATAEEVSAREASAQQPTKPSATDPMTALRSFAQTQLGPQIDDWRNRSRQIEETRFDSATAKNQAFIPIEREIAETITNLQLRDAWTPEADRFYGETVKVGTPKVEAFMRTVDRLIRPKNVEQNAAGQMTQEKAARVKEAQGIYANLMSQSEAPGITEADARSFREQAAIIGDNISTELGNKELAPLDWKSQIEGTRKAIQAVTEAGGGTVNYRGIEYAPEEFGQLDKYLQTDEKNAWIKATQNPGSLRVSLQAAKLNEDGTPLKTQDERDNRYMALREQLNPNEWYQDLDGSVKIYGGPEEEAKELDMIPKRLKPALRGAGVVAGNVAEAVAPMLTEENVAMAANAVLPVVGYGSVKTTAAAMRNPQEAVAKLGRAAVTAGIPFGMLAMKGIDYLSEVGRKAEEEEKKKLAGQ